MKKVLAIAGLTCITAATFAQNKWAIAGDKIKTPWADKVDPANALPEYPRPQMVRGDWKNLNGLWDYAILRKDAAKPTTFRGRILVPFAVGSA